MYEHSKLLSLLQEPVQAIIVTNLQSTTSPANTILFLGYRMFTFFSGTVRAHGKLHVIHTKNGMKFEEDIQLTLDSLSNACCVQVRVGSGLC